VCPQEGRQGRTGGEPQAAQVAEVGGGRFLSFEGRREESCILIFDLNLAALIIGRRKMSSSVKECHSSSLDMYE